MTTQVAPTASSFSGIDGLSDYSVGAMANSEYLKNSVYDNAGNLLFSVNEDAIYDPTGVIAYDFVFPAFTCSVTVAGTDYVFQPQYAVSEISIFPVTKYADNHSYYVAFWAYDGMSSTTGTGMPKNDLRVIKVDVAPATGALTFTDNVLYDEHTTNGMMQIAYAGTKKFVIAAGPASCGTTRTIYTVEPYTPYLATSNTSNLRKWIFGADGSLPSHTATTYIANEPPAYCSKAKILKIGGEQFFCYIAGTDNLAGPTWANEVAACKVSDGTGNLTTYSMYSGYNIYGFEYVPTLNGMYISYRHQLSTGYDPTTSGLQFMDISTATATMIPASADYANTDIELAKNGFLYLVNGVGTSVTDDGKLAYLPVSTSGFSPTTTLPTVISSSCSSSVSVANFINNSSISVYTYYLGSQIKDEDYEKTSRLTVSSNDTWTPIDNPLTRSSGFTTASVLKASNITISPGASLTIENMTLQMDRGSYLDVLQGNASTTGGKLTLDHAIVTANLPSCTLTTDVSIWGGIRVMGDPTQPQGLTGGKQGYLNIINNSEISYARVGVSVAELVPFTIPVYMAGSWFTGLSIAGGGIVKISNSRFYNNNYGVIFGPYRNFSAASPSVEINNLSNFYKTTFINDNVNCITEKLADIWGQKVKGIRISGSTFTNNITTPSAFPSYGIYADDMGFNVEQAETTFPPSFYASTFSGFTNGIFQQRITADYAPTILNAIFTNNTIGINLSGTFGPIITGNTFNIPNLYNTLFSTIPPYYSTYSIQSIGVMLNAANYYTINSNTFQNASPSHIPRFGMGNETVGVLAWNTGINDNIINNNTYRGLGTGNLCNYKNRQGYNHGLWFKCNNNKDNSFDIAIRGVNNNIDIGDGIRNYQGTTTRPAANVFTSSCSNFNIYNLSGECGAINYYYSSSPLAAEIPGIPCTTGNNFDYSVVTTPLISAINNCSLADADPGGRQSGHHVIDISLSSELEDLQSIKVNNIRYYSNTVDGITLRDSLYYWVGQLQTAYGDMMIANMLLTDSLVDSAYKVYTGIPVKYKLDSLSTKEYAEWGLPLFTVQVAEGLLAGMPTVTFAVLKGQLKIMSDSALRSAATTTMVSVFSSARGWPRIQAENMLRRYDPVLLDSLLHENPDTLLYPVVPDSLKVIYPSHKGVLTITEISQGPTYGCQYVELAVGNCSSDISPYVNVQGWIINDNTGNFNSARENDENGCDTTTSNTPGHYRLAYDSVWAHVPIGSIIAVYNHDVNCYNLPDTFTIDSIKQIYWIPIGGTESSPYGNPHMERFGGAENNCICNYCSDTGRAIYTTAADWMNTIGLDSATDGIQVLCPGCTVANPAAPDFYHGVGYDPNYVDFGLLGSASLYSVGLLRTSNTAVGYKYVYYTGSDARSLVDVAFWSATPADPAGSIPTTLGNVDSIYFDGLINNSLGLPCCQSLTSGNGCPTCLNPIGMRQSIDSAGHINNSAAKSVLVIRAFPNPATMMLNFEFPLSDETTIRIIDVTGRTMEQQVVHRDTKASFNVKRYPEGQYLYQVVTDRKTQSGKILIGK